MHCGGLDAARIATGIAAHLDHSTEEQREGEAEAESLDEVHGVVLEWDEEAKHKAYDQRGEAEVQKPPVSGSLLHGLASFAADARGEVVKTDPLGRAVARR
jgi:hypothetical protein